MEEDGHVNKSRHLWNTCFWASVQGEVMDCNKESLLTHWSLAQEIGWMAAPRTELENLRSGAHLWGRYISSLLGMWVLGAHRNPEIGGCLDLNTGEKIVLEYRMGVISAHMSEA